MTGAISDLTKVLTLNNKDHKAYERRAYFYYKIGEFISAIKDLDKAIKIKPNVYAFNSRGFYKTKINDLKGALIDHSRAIEIDPYHAFSLQ